MAKAPWAHAQRLVLGLTSNTDLTSFQYKAVSILTDGVCGLPASSTNGFYGGILENKPNSGTGAECRVCIWGPTKAVVSAAITMGDEVIFSGTNNTATGYITNITSSTSYTTATSNTLPSTWVAGQALQTASAASEVVTIFINQRKERIG